MPFLRASQDQLTQPNLGLISAPFCVLVQGLTHLSANRCFVHENNKITLQAYTQAYSITVKQSLDYAIVKGTSQETQTGIRLRNISTINNTQARVSYTIIGLQYLVRCPRRREFQVFKFYSTHGALFSRKVKKNEKLTHNADSKPQE